MVDTLVCEADRAAGVKHERMEFEDLDAIWELCGASARGERSAGG